MQTLRLSFRLLPRRTPDVHPVPPHDHGCAARVPLDRVPQGIRQVAFSRRVIDDRHFECVIISMCANSFDHLKVCRLEMTSEHEGYEYNGRVMRMQTGSSSTHLIRQVKQGGTFAQFGRAAGIKPCWWYIERLAFPVQTIDVLRHHPLLLHTGGSHVGT